ncbi:MAG: hypothetical protein ACT4O0_01525 [Pseudonocardia sp.]
MNVKIRSVAELEAAVLDGDTTITHAEIAESRAAEHLAKLQGEGARRQAEKAAEAEEQRQGALARLYDEVGATAPGKLGELGRDVVAAMEAFRSGVVEHNDRVRGWTEREAALIGGRPAMDGVRVGDRVIRRVRAEAWLARAFEGARKGRAVDFAPLDNQ